MEKIGAKITEEAAEVVEAAGEPGEAGQEHFIREVGDLVYHLMVLMCHEISRWPTWRPNLPADSGSLD